MTVFYVDKQIVTRDAGDTCTYQVKGPLGPMSPAYPSADYKDRLDELTSLMNFAYAIGAGGGVDWQDLLERAAQMVEKAGQLDMAGMRGLAGEIRKLKQR
jgi:hypothetical protein